MRRSRVSFVRMTSLWQRDKGTPSGQSIHSYYVCRQPNFLLNNNVSSDAKVYDNWKPSQWLDLQVQCQGRALRSHLTPPESWLEESILIFYYQLRNCWLIGFIRHKILNVCRPLQLLSLKWIIQNKFKVSCKAKHLKYIDWLTIQHISYRIFKFWYYIYILTAMPVPLYPHGAPKKPFYSLIANSLTLFEVENCCILVHIFR